MRPARNNQAPRLGEFILAKDGIDREVITTDICRYLGNDALVRPGLLEGQEVYIIRAYRNLTTEMIADLKADSARWERERRDTASRAQPTGVDYQESRTHQIRQYTGPSESGSPVYGQHEQPQYDAAPGYPSYSQPVTYPSQTAYVPAETPPNLYYAGANRPTAPSNPTSRNAPGYGQAPPMTPYVPDSRGQPNQFYQPPPPPQQSAPQQYTSQPQDAFYNRGNSYESSMDYEPSYPTQNMAPTPPTGSRRRERDDRDADREGHRHRRR